MPSSPEHTKAHIELAIERARENLGDRIDELDRRIRQKLDFEQIAKDHAPQLVATGAALGFLIGFGVPKVLLRTVQLGVPILLAVTVMKKRLAERTDDAPDFPL